MPTAREPQRPRASTRTIAALVAVAASATAVTTVALHEDGGAPTATAATAQIEAPAQPTFAASPGVGPSQGSGGS